MKRKKNGDGEKMDVKITAQPLDMTLITAYHNEFQLFNRLVTLIRFEMPMSISY